MKIKYYIIIFAIILTSSCSHNQGKPVLPQIWDETYISEKQAHMWTKSSNVQLLCYGMKNWKNKNIRDASKSEIKKRNIDTKSCYQFKDYNLNNSFE
jgi:hypothetical protein